MAVRSGTEHTLIKVVDGLIILKGLYKLSLTQGYLFANLSLLSQATKLLDLDLLHLNLVCTIYLTKVSP